MSFFYLNLCSIRAFGLNIFLLVINSHIQYIIVYGTGFDKKLKLINIIS